MDGIGPISVIRQIGFGRLAPNEIREGCHCQAPLERHIAPAGNLVKALRRAGQVPIPEDIDAHRARDRARLLMRNPAGKLLPVLDGHRQLAAVLQSSLHGIRHRVSVGSSGRPFRPMLGESLPEHHPPFLQ